MHFSLASCSLMPRLSKYSPQHFVFKHPQFTLFPERERQCFRAIKNRQNYGFVYFNPYVFTYQAGRRQSLNSVISKTSLFKFFTNKIVISYYGSAVIILWLIEYAKAYQFIWTSRNCDKNSDTSDPCANLFRPSGYFSICRANCFTYATTASIERTPIPPATACFISNNTKEKPKRGGAAHRLPLGIVLYVA
jgi:hypothetical protein